VIHPGFWNKATPLEKAQAVLEEPFDSGAGHQQQLILMRGILAALVSIAGSLEKPRKKEHPVPEQAPYGFE
jgi:hypothetical protein